MHIGLRNKAILDIGIFYNNIAKLVFSLLNCRQTSGEIYFYWFIAGNHRKHVLYTGMPTYVY